MFIYGAAPVTASVYTSDDDLDDAKEEAKNKEGSTKTLKLKHALSFSRRRRRRRNNDTDDEDTLDGDSIRLTKSSSRRRSISLASSTVTLEGLEHAVGLNSRYSLAGGLPVTPTDSDASKDDYEDSDGEDVIDVEYDEEDPPDNTLNSFAVAAVSSNVPDSEIKVGSNAFT